ncbi:hypothetical protein G7069_08760 [Lysobacter sp. HDW10]|uniref:hypothetical protein n=1 Tax=Lysobacter sp. HDW10 TaxID=2714936 RepID=UPI00140A418F|nr:hypothetical protein [Lysobacter sp. HDW10]QIK81676.1 hypothetical protein G7069_08760 [Lysobacter sp. HDW10]
MKVTILPQIHEKQWSKGDRSGVIRTQDCVYENPIFRGKGRIDIGKSDPYKPGEYELDLEAAVSLDDFGGLKLARRPEMKLVREASPAPASK